MLGNTDYDFMSSIRQSITERGQTYFGPQPEQQPESPIEYFLREINSSSVETPSSESALFKEEYDAYMNERRARRKALRGSFSTPHSIRTCQTGPNPLPDSILECQVNYRG